MELYFFRHGEAETASAGGTDDSRELTARGRQESRVMAEALLRAGLRLEAICTSPLARARQTGEILGEVFGLPPQADERLRCGAAFGAVQALAAERGLARILFVGHEPDLSTIVHQLTGG
ncbi:MAG: phosphohistidine phosphatase SixA, partial [Armatimonadetes bacterium]|nr:phosphohistidine phosphatase SixA [Armatimonadota bacterium]